mmetsp:Transcript_66060/g.182433  ORF Transcript_66060/g.182433 Transcript_66060/m.182433 type:complete len:111 (-) Transcript_66060:240-572(-)
MFGTMIHASKSNKPQINHKMAEAMPTQTKGRLIVTEHCVSNIFGNVANNEQAPTTLQTQEANPQRNNALWHGKTVMATNCVKATTEAACKYFRKLCMDCLFLQLRWNPQR